MKSAAQAGFTLVEILLAMTIMAGAALVAVPLLRRPPAQAQLAADSARLAAALRITRAAAMSQNREISLQLDPDRRTYGSAVVPTAALDSRTEVAVNAHGEDAIRFFPSGRSNGGLIRLRLDRFQSRLSIVWATGNVFVD
jgi:general secretion pathway protein H